MACKDIVVPSFRKANERSNPSLHPKYRFDTSVPDGLLEQARISIPSWKPGTRRGRLGAIEEHLQESGTL